MVSEAYLPEECARCILRALSNPASVVSTDRYDEAFRELQEWNGGDADPDATEKWSATSMDMPGQGPARHALVESGFDLAGESYASTPITSQDVTFACPND